MTHEDYITIRSGLDTGVARINFELEAAIDDDYIDELKDDLHYIEEAIDALNKYRREEIA